MIRGNRRLFSLSPDTARTLRTAAEIARDSGKDEIDPDDVLGGLLREESGPAGRVLRSLGIADFPSICTDAEADANVPAEAALDEAALRAVGIDLAAVEALAESEFGPGALRRPPPPAARVTPFGARAKRMLIAAIKEAKRGGELSVEPEHLLLGISATRGGHAWTKLRQASGHQDLRSAVLRERAAQPGAR